MTSAAPVLAWYAMTSTAKLLVAAALFVLLALPVAAGAANPPATASASVKKTVKKLKKQVKAQKQQLAEFEQQLAQLEGAPGPPSGSAGGDLAGAYPNPLIAGSAVGSAEVADNSLGILDIGNNAVGSAEVADNSLGILDIGNNAVGPGEIENPERSVNLPLTRSSTSATSRRWTSRRRTGRGPISIRALPTPSSSSSTTILLGAALTRITP
jgi:hypothetical protein